MERFAVTKAELLARVGFLEKRVAVLEMDLKKLKSIPNEYHRKKF